MPRGVKPDGAPAPAEPKGAKGAKGKALSVAKAPLKKKEKDVKEQKAPADGGSGGFDMAELEKKRKELADQLQKCEVQIHRLESQYLDTANPQGNALRGYDALLSATAVSAQKAHFRPEDRIFSGSSTSGGLGH
ncbi:Chromatin modification-related protein MEAF6 [Tetrabaena socialis]|uniref:Chromatin modification-related protein MEAF6 n=1 Tax=Tetrabaena socialis TaxID=47790 RepID=A0A2J8A5E3_9CHLO|nr:Chromatin modification-related protein MEAF6 [Tetrabaena socialis]|eukprot:PNH07752.1 Chromatin modification-related protein MEAF6 [Tetrabaena socialis]